MNKLLDVVTDSALLMILAIIFIVPLLISFNLDPEVKHTTDGEANISGITDIKTNNGNIFSFEPAHLEQSNVILSNHTHNSNFYSCNITIGNESIISTSFTLGTLTNNANRDIPVTARVQGDQEALEAVRISIQFANGNSFTLFNGLDFEELSFVLLEGATEEITLQVESDYVINYELEFEIQFEEK